MTKYLHWPNKGKLRVMGFASGSGNTFWKALELQKELELTSEGSPFEIVGLFSDNPNSKSVQHAQQIGLPWVSIDLRDYHKSKNKPLRDRDTRVQFDQEVFELIKPFQADLIFLAGYVWATTEAIVDNFLIVNVHPADLSVIKEGHRPYAGANGVGDTLAGREVAICSSSHIATKDIDGGPLLFLSPPIPIDYSLFDNLDELKRHTLKLVNDQSRLIGARALLEIAEGNITLNEQGIICYKGEPVPNGIRINNWSENKPRYDRETIKMIAPKSIAVIGASAKGGLGNSILNNIVKGGFQGDIFAINRSGEDISGVKAYTAVRDIPTDIDMAVITLPSALVLDVVRECGQKGIKAIVCISAGFKETGGEGIENEKELKRILDQYNMRMIGPNCMGVLNTDSKVNLNATMLQHASKKGNIAFITQSGALGAALLDYAEGLGMGFSVIASLGNQTDINASDLLVLLEQDEATEVVMLYLESIVEPHRFLKMAQKISQKKAVIIIKSGRTKAGAQAASSHTGSIAGSDIVTDALLKKAGVIRVNTLEDAYYLSLALSKMPRLKGKRVGVVTNAGGPGILLADRLSDMGFEMPVLSNINRAELATKLFPEASTGNPLDVVAAAPPEHYAHVVETMLHSGQYDALLVVCVPPATIDTGAVARSISKTLEQSTIPVLCCFLGPTLGKPAREVLKEVGIPFVEYPEKLAEILKYMEIRNVSLPQSGGVASNAQLEGKNILKPYLSGSYLTSVDSFRLLQSYGFKVPNYRLITSQEDMADLELSYPIVAKIEHPDVIHKSDVEGVILNIQCQDELKKTIDELLHRFPGARGVLLQEQAIVTIELLLGGKLEEGVGHIVMVGYGGTHVEIFKDVSVGFVPITENEGDAMLKELKCYPLLEGYRGSKGVNLELLKMLLDRLSQLLMDYPEISEVDLNPITYDEANDIFKVLDCRIKI